MTDTAIARGHETIGAMLDARYHDGRPDSQLATAADAARYAAAALAAHAGNPLIAALDETGLGDSLDPDQVTAVIGIVRMLESTRPAAQNALMP